MFVSIAIPFYNAESYLADAIRSVFAQTHQDWELVLIDDGSTDRSLEIAMAVQDPRVTVISDGKNKRLAARLNEFTSVAKYDYIVRMDADDLMMPERIERLLSIIVNNDVDIVTSGVYSVLNNLKIVGTRGTNYNFVTFHDVLSRKVGITHAALIAKKSWYERNRYDESLTIAQDLDLWIRSSKNNDLKIISIEDPLYIYREESNITKDKILRAYKNERTMITKYGEKSFKGLIIKSHIKSTAIVALGLFGMIHLLQKNRGKKEISKQERESYDVAIRKILITKVSGLDE